jgi:hypothetical protein
MTKRATFETWNRFGRSIKRHSWWLGLVPLIALAAALSYQVAPVPAAASRTEETQAQAQDPAMQGVLAYLRVHSGISSTPAPTAQLDPGQQAIMRYIHVHEPTAQPASLWDTVKQTLAGYLRGSGR